MALHVHVHGMEWHEYATLPACRQVCQTAWHAKRPAASRPAGRLPGLQVSRRCGWQGPDNTRRRPRPALTVVLAVHDGEGRGGRSPACCCAGAPERPRLAQAKAGVRAAHLRPVTTSVVAPPFEVRPWRAALAARNASGAARLVRAAGPGLS